MKGRESKRRNFFRLLEDEVRICASSVGDIRTLFRDVGRSYDVLILDSSYVVRNALRRFSRPQSSELLRGEPTLDLVQYQLVLESRHLK